MYFRLSSRKMLPRLGCTFDSHYCQTPRPSSTTWLGHNIFQNSSLDYRDAFSTVERNSYVPSSTVYLCQLHGVLNINRPDREIRYDLDG